MHTSCFFVAMLSFGKYKFRRALLTNKAKKKKMVGFSTDKGGRQFAALHHACKWLSTKIFAINKRKHILTWNFFNVFTCKQSIIKKKKKALFSFLDM